MILIIIISISDQPNLHKLDENAPLCRSLIQHFGQNSQWCQYPSDRGTYRADLDLWSIVSLQPGVQIIWSNSICCLHTSAALQLQLFVSDLPLNQSEYTADTLSSYQNRVDRRKWNFNGPHWPIYNKLYPAMNPNSMKVLKSHSEERVNNLKSEISLWQSIETPCISSIRH